MDFLSFRPAFPFLEEGDYIVLNSVSNLQKAFLSLHDMTASVAVWTMIPPEKCGAGIKGEIRNPYM